MCRFVLKPVALYGLRNLEGVFCGDNFLFVPAMSQLVAELQAAGAYLEKAQNFPGFKEAKERQINVLCGVLQRGSVSTSEASQLLETLQQQSVWEAEEKARLASHVHCKGPHVSSSRVTLQDFAALPLYFPQSLWSQLLSKEFSSIAKAGKIACFGANLGLRSPTETTSQMVCALVLHLPNCDWPTYDCHQLHENFLLVKKELRAAGQAQPANDALPHVEKLPLHFVCISFFHSSITWKMLVFFKFCSSGNQKLEALAADGPTVAAECFGGRACVAKPYQLH